MGEELCGQLQAVVLMGGLGTRLGEITEKCPKAMLDINGRPFFWYQFELLLQAGFRRFVFCLGYRAEAVREYFGDGSRWGVEIKYSYDGEQLLGTGGAVRRALPLLMEDFLLLYGDSFMDIDYFEVVVRYRNAVQAGKRALMTVMENGDRFDKSNVLCKDGGVLLYDKRCPDSRMSYIDYGISVFRRDVFAHLAPDEPLDLSDIQHDLSAAGLLAGCEVEHRFYEIGTPESLEEFRVYAKQRWDSPNRAVFLDRDGVINELYWNEDTEQLDSPLKRAHFRLLPGVTQALRALQEAGYLLFIVTNQPAAAKGKTTYEELCAINHDFVRQMQREGVEIAEVAMCPHYGALTARTREKYLIRDCGCRKPKTGLIDRIQEKYSIDRENSWMVGDSATDILCGKGAGLHTAFLGKFKCDLCMMIGNQKPDVVCEDLPSFARHMQKR